MAKPSRLEMSIQSKCQYHRGLYEALMAVLGAHNDVVYAQLARLVRKHRPELQSLSDKQVTELLDAMYCGGQKAFHKAAAALNVSDSTARH